MGNSQSAFKFYEDSQWIEIYGQIAINSVMVLVSCLGLNLLRIKQGCKNYTVLILLLSMLAMAVTGISMQCF